MDLSVIATAFILVLPVELPDKTLFASLVLATRFPPLPVFVGVGAAFGLQVAIAVMAGSLLSLLPDALVSGVVALLFLIGAVLLWRSANEGPEDADDVAAGKEAHSFLKIAATRKNDVPCRVSASSSSSGPLLALRHRITAPTRNSTATTPLTSASGSSESSEPAVTAMATCTPNAVPTPTNTGSGGKRVARTSDANSVLSGSSTGRTSTKAVRMTVRDTGISFPSGRCRTDAGTPPTGSRGCGSKVSPTHDRAWAR